MTRRRYGSRRGLLWPLVRMGGDVRAIRRGTMSRRLARRGGYSWVNMLVRGLWRK